MEEQRYILAVDQGTSSTKVLLLGDTGSVAARGMAVVDVRFEGNHVEQSPEQLYESVLASVSLCLDEANRVGISGSAIRTIGITNQRETFVLWDQHGQPVCPAISWQCKRSSAICDRLVTQGYDALIKEKTGLVVDPYFSGTKLCWLLEEVPAVKQAVEAGRIYFGTVDTWLLYRLTGGRHYLTDHTNASRTMLFNIHSLQWDQELIQLLGLARLNLPEVCPSAFDYGETDFGGILSVPVPIQAVIGDSQAAAVGAGCLQPGEAKATLGTGCSVMMTVGQRLASGGSDTVDAICYSTKDTVAYASEGIIVSCGATMEWLKVQLGLFEDIGQVEALVRQVPADHGVYLLPAFSGMGTPYWRKDAKAAIVGLTFASNRYSLLRAALEAVGFQVCDVVRSMQQEHGVALAHLHVNGGMATNGFVLQFLANLLDKPVYRGAMTDASAMGCAYLAARLAGFDAFSIVGDAVGDCYATYPDAGQAAAQSAYAGWQEWVGKLF